MFVESEKNFDEERNAQLNKLRFFLIAMLVILSVQGWTGDYVNLFSVFPTGAVSSSANGLLQALQKAGQVPLYHAFEGFLLLAFSLVVLFLSLRTKAKSVQVSSILGFAAVVSAAIGGILFVFSGFQDNGNSAQMGGSFISAYAFYFIELYFTKRS
jgi:heme A synthase